ncbi:MAG: LysR family transcriptional regulator [Pseudorhodoplanes sp.]|uniref:LysR family transcriptional regulator n=1 Tax=Pseudorhodoplanes sp. TaxID=1934341 RepID=UPI003D143251
MDWNDLKYFLAVARSHSLTEASRALRVSNSTIARRIAALEQSVAAVLFTKRNDGYTLTAPGQAFFERAEQAESKLLWLERNGAVPIHEYAGSVRLALPELLGQHFIVPSLPAFFRLHPAVQLELLADVRPLNLTKRQADLLVRLVCPSHGDYLMRRVGSLAMAVYGSPDYIATYGLPETYSDLPGHRLIGWDNSLGYLPFSRWLFDAIPNANITFRAHTMSTQLAAVQAGIGVAVLPAVVAKKFGLKRVLTSDAPFYSEIWLLQSADTKHVARVRALSEHIAGYFETSTEMLTRAD